MVTKLVARGGLVLSAEQKAKLQAVIWNEKGQINARIVAQPAAAIAELAGFSIPAGTEFFLAPETGWGPSHPFSGEKMCVTAALYRARDLGHAIEITRGIQAYQGSGHSAGIYTSDKGSALALAHALDTSRLLVNQPQAASNSGNLWNGLRQTFSLGCGSWGGNSVNHNVTWRDLVNFTWVSYNLPEPKVLPSDDVLFARVKDRTTDRT
mmetsp:Transcript_50671/g.115072  ORF Transcript_50671/g.115072 Transcript_50671/m.115072 type:complete len:209 (-) Transcript_50671:273-899(-)